jgi:hypothetical protein
VTPVGGAPAPAPAPSVPLLLRAIAAGGARFERIVLTRNRRVMASIAEGGRTLRLHEAFREAPPAVLRALGELFASRSASARARARGRVQAFLADRIPAHAPPRRRPHRPLPGDRPHLDRLLAEFRRVNSLHFGGELPEVPLRLSGRMSRRNGHFSADPLEIAISRRLCLAAADGETERTLRHEMIHLWQHQEGRKPGHGADFRRWARMLDIHPRATRSVCWVE